MWYLKKYKVVNMAGSLVQAGIVYDYFTGYCDIHHTVSQSVAGQVTQSYTEAEDGHYFSCVTASPKQVRGKHPDALLSDETCETSDELIDSALPMVNDSKHPIVVMASTFHKIFGRFAETWDNAEQRGYLRIQWDIFDVCSPFSPTIWEDPKYKDIQGIEKLKAFAKGRTGDPEGWVPIENVIQAWREKPTQDWFEVEYLGTRPSAAGLVLKPEDVDRAVFDSELDKRYNYVQGATVVIGIDWGFSSMTAVTEVMGWKDHTAVLLNNKNYSQVSSEDIIKDIVAMVKARGIRFIYADSAGKFENVALQNALVKEKLSATVIEVVFSKEKFGTPGKDGSIGMLGNLRAHFEQGKIKLAKKFIDAYYQLKNYRYEPGSDKPVKKNDHIPDSLMCALQHFKLGQVTKSIPTKELPPAKTKAEETERAKPITSGLRNKTF